MGEQSSDAEAMALGNGLVRTTTAQADAVTCVGVSTDGFELQDGNPLFVSRMPDPTFPGRIVERLAA